MVDDTTQERWLPVPGYEGRYEVSDHGRVWCCGYWVKRGHGSRAWWGPRMAKGTRRKASPGYIQYVLSSEDGKRTAHLAQTLVLSAFVGPRPYPKACGLHRDDVATNNHVSNLYWGSQGDNADDRERNGRKPHHDKDCCPRGHRLVGANLVSNAASVGRRACRACAITSMARRYDPQRKRQGRTYRLPCGFWRDLDETFDQEADRRYLFIMDQAAS